MKEERLPKRQPFLQKYIKIAEKKVIDTIRIIFDYIRMSKD